jgi:assimilatory nitrate reductase catalytic subunit
MHPQDAAAAGLTEGMLARVRTPRGEAVAVAKISDRQRPGALFMPMHWTEAFAPQGRSNHLIGPHRDAASGQPEFKHSPARLTAWRDTWRGFFLSRSRADAPQGAALIWRRAVREACHLHEFAGRGDEVERNWVAKALSASAQGEMLSLDDAAIGSFRRAWIVDGRLERVLFVTEAKLPPRDWLAGLFEAETLSPLDRMALLAGRPLGPVEDVGPIICACMKVGATTIAKAAAAGATTVEAVGVATGAGTNCGSCRVEIARLIASTEMAHAA